MSEAALNTDSDPYSVADWINEVHEQINELHNTLNRLS